MEIFKILEQLALLPIKVAQGLLEFARKGHAVPINLWVMVEGRKYGTETRLFLGEDESKKGVSPAQPAATP